VWASGFAFGCTIVPHRASLRRASRFPLGAGSRLLISKNVLSVSDQESWIRELGTARGHESCASPLQPCSDGPLVPSIECGDAKSGRLVYSIAFQSYVRHEVHANYPEAAGWRHHSSASMAPFGFAPTCVTCPFSEQPMMHSFHCRHHRAKAGMHCARSTHGVPLTHLSCQRRANAAGPTFVTASLQ
jgi:hypothetical protein